MFSDVYLVSAWFGFIFLMLLFKVPFFLAGGKPHLGHRVYSLRLFPSEHLPRWMWHRRRC